MRLTRFLLRLTPAAIVVLAGCGQTGPLYLPDAGVETPVEVRSPSAPEAAPMPTPTPTPPPAPEPDDKEKKSGEPKGR